MTPHETAVRRTVRSVPLWGSAAAMVLAIYGMASISTVAALSLGAVFGLLLATFANSLYQLHRITIASEARGAELRRQLGAESRAGFTRA